jgi:hypothetical protein
LASALPSSPRQAATTRSASPNPAIYARSHIVTDVVDKAAQAGRTPLSNVADFGLVNGILNVKLVAFG